MDPGLRCGVPEVAVRSEQPRSWDVASTLVMATGPLHEESTMEKCAHPACLCMVDKKGPYGKYCSDHCQKAGDVTELRCGCRHPECQ